MNDSVRQENVIVCNIHKTKTRDRAQINLLNTYTISMSRVKYLSKYSSAYCLESTVTIFFKPFPITSPNKISTDIESPNDGSY